MDQTGWNKKLSLALAVIRTALNSTTRNSPHFLFGCKERTIAEVIYPNDRPDGGQSQRTEKFCRLREIHDIARTRDNMQSYPQRQKKNAWFTLLKKGESMLY